MSTTAPPSRQELHDSSPSASPRGGKWEEELRQAAIANLKRKRKFIENAVGYVTVNGALWLIWALADRSSDGIMPWPAWVSAIWGFFLAMDAWKAYGRWPSSLYRPITEADIEHELERARRS